METAGLRAAAGEATERLQVLREVLSMGPKRLVLTLAIRFVVYFVQLRIAKVKTSLLGPIDSTLLNLEGMDNQEIADELQVSLNTVKFHKKNAYKLLRDKLKDQFYLLFLI